MVDMDLSVLSKRCLIKYSRQSIVLYVDPKTYRIFFFHFEKERGNKSKQPMELFIYIFLFPDFDSFQVLPFLLFCQVNKKEHPISDFCLWAFFFRRLFLPEEELSDRTGPTPTTCL